MSSYQLYQSKITDRLRQYGVYASFKQLCMASLRVIYRQKRNLIFIMPNFAGYSCEDKRVEPLDVCTINQASISGKLNKTTAKLIANFLENGCKGVYVEVHGEIAGYGLVQFEGEYQFGKTGRMMIPPGYAIAKNLHVFHEFRGKKIGQILNMARLAIIPAGITPVGFIIPENRYAIRNWEKYGFRRVLFVKRWKWFFSKWKMEIKVISDNRYAQELRHALLAGFAD